MFQENEEEDITQHNFCMKLKLLRGTFTNVYIEKEEESQISIL